MRWVAPLVLITLVSASCGDPGGVPVPQAQAASTTPDKPARSIPKGRIKSIAFEEFFTLHQSGNILLIDARPAFFYNLGHIP